MAPDSHRWSIRRAVVAAMALSSGVLGEDILQTIGFSSCGNQSEVRVNKVDIKYNNANKTVTFDVSGTSTRVQNVTAELNVNAYGIQIYENKFNPCDAATFVQQLCPVPAGTFSARGSQQIPAEFAKLVPGIAFQIPDIAAMATLQLRAVDSNQSVACIQSKVSNGKTASVPSVSYVAAGIAGAALIVTGASALGAVFASGGGAAGGGSSTTGGSGTISPSFSEVFGYFQGMAMNGMLSVNYPPVYRSFTKNFGFSMGLIPWTQLQGSIDDFRGRTGGNLTQDSIQVLQRSTLVFTDGSTASGNSSALRVKRALETFAVLVGRQIETNINGDTGSPANSTEGKNTFEQAVSGIQAYVNQLSVPKSNTFMTVLLVVAIVIAAIAVGILLVKVILEAWALFGNFPKSLAGFRKHYWGSIARAITALIFLLYGIWVLYCIFQFTQGDSWGAKALAGVTLALFTAILIFFSWKIWSVARKLKRAEGDAAGLYDEKTNWVKYSLFYDCYKKSYWWLFLPTIIYMFVKGAMLAAMDGKGMAQTVSQIAIEALMLILLLWSRPFERKSGNVINVTIQVVRVLSVVLILVFVQELEIAQTTQTVAGFALIVVQSVLTGVLAILILWNAFNQCCQRNPHRQRRKDMEKRVRDMDNLTPLDARNSLLLDRPKSGETSTTFSMSNTTEKPTAMARSASPERYLGQEAYYDAPRPQNNFNTAFRPITPNNPAYGDQSRDGLMSNAAPIGRFDTRQPTLPNLGLPGSRFSPDMYGGNPYGGGYNQGYGNGSGPYRAPSRGGY